MNPSHCKIYFIMPIVFIQYYIWQSIGITSSLSRKRLFCLSLIPLVLIPCGGDDTRGFDLHHGSYLEDWYYWHLNHVNARLSYWLNCNEERKVTWESVIERAKQMREWEAKSNSEGEGDAKGNSCWWERFNKLNSYRYTFTISSVHTFHFFFCSVILLSGVYLFLISINLVNSQVNFKF